MSHAWDIYGFCNDGNVVLQCSSCKCFLIEGMYVHAYNFYSPTHFKSFITLNHITVYEWPSLSISRWDRFINQYKCSDTRWKLIVKLLIFSFMLFKIIRML